MEIMTQAWSLGVTALSSLLPCLPSLEGPRRQKDARHLFPGQGEMVTKDDEKGTELGQPCVVWMEVETFL